MLKLFLESVQKFWDHFFTAVEKNKIWIAIRFQSGNLVNCFKVIYSFFQWIVKVTRVLIAEHRQFKT